MPMPLPVPIFDRRGHDHGWAGYGGVRRGGALGDGIAGDDGIAGRGVTGARRCLAFRSAGQSPVLLTRTARYDLVRQIDALQHELSEGPCLDALRKDHTVASDNLATDARWPRWGPQVAEQLGLQLGVLLLRRLEAVEAAENAVADAFGQSGFTRRHRADPRAVLLDERAGLDEADLIEMMRISGIWGDEIWTTCAESRACLLTTSV